MDLKTIKYCAYLKRDHEFWQEALGLARELIYGSEDRMPSEDPAKELLEYYRIPCWDQDLANFTEEFLQEVDCEMVADIICDAAEGGRCLKEFHAAIERELESTRRRMMFLEVNINGVRKMRFEDLGGCIMLDASMEPEAA